MINLSSSAMKIRIILPPVDMRKSFDGLTGVLREYCIANLNAQFLYVFSNKRRNRIKLLYFDRTGIYVVAKRLEVGTFSWPPPREASETVLPLAPEALQLLLDGVDLRGAQLREWYRAEN
jgi:transposase